MFQKLLMAASVLVLSVTGFAQGRGQKLEGSWLVAITLDGASAPFGIDVATYDAKGSLTVISSDRSFSDAVGSYQRVGEREFTSTHVHIIYNEKGVFGGIAKVISTQRLNDAGDAFTGRYRVEVSDATGKVGAKITGSITGRAVIPEQL